MPRMKVMPVSEVRANLASLGELAAEISRFRGRFTQMHYCFSGETAQSMTKDLIDVLGV